MKFILIVLLLAGACSYKKNNQTLKGHEELYSEPDEPSLSDLSKDETRVIIASTNDLHGNYAPKTEESVQIGGESVISTYFSILRNTYKNVVLVDAGDIFGSATDTKPIELFYETNQYDAITVGLRDFNLKVPSKIGTTSDLLQNFAKSSKAPLLLSNLYELKTARTVEWEGIKPYIIKEVDGVKVGIIGLIPDDIVAQTPVHNRVGLFVENMLQSTLRHARLVRSLGADIVVVLTHQGLDCGSEMSVAKKLPLTKVNFEPKKNVCNMKSSLGVYLERLPPGLVDVVVGGRTHQKMANFVNGTLVIGSYPDGKSFSYTEFVVNKKTKQINAEKTVVHQPVYFCNEFFKETKDCYSEDTSVDHKKKIPATFLGQAISPDKTTAMNPVLKTTPEVSKNLIRFEADLSYFPETSGETQLMIMKLSGRELVKVLEEDYNNKRAKLWQPSPFLMKKNDLTISIAGQELQLEKTYRILTDLESMQKHSMFVKKVTSYDSESLVNHSWNSVDEDIVSSALAAQRR